MPIDTPPKINTTEKFVPPPLIAGDEASLTAFKEWLRQNIDEMPEWMRVQLMEVINAHQGVLAADKKVLTEDEINLFKGALREISSTDDVGLQPIAPASFAIKPTGRSRVNASGATLKPANASTVDTQTIMPASKAPASGEVKTLEDVDFKEGITAETLEKLLSSLDALVKEAKNFRSAAGLSDKEALAQSPAFKALRSEIIRLRNRLIKEKEGKVVDKNEMMEIKKSLLINLITYKAEIEALKNDPDVPPPPPDNPDAKTPEQLAYETARGLWSSSKKEMTTAEVSRFSPEYAQLKIEIQNFNTKGMPIDVAEKAKLRHLDMKEKVEGIEKRYLEAKSMYASSLEQVIATSRTPEERAKLQSLIVARFFAKTGEERYQNSFEHSTKSIAERTANRSDYRSYREREISLNEEILSEKKKSIFGKLKAVWGKVPPSMKMGIGGAAIGIAVAGGGWVPVIGAMGASIATKGTINFAGNSLFGRRQERKNDQTRLRGIMATRASGFASFESSLEKGDRSLRNIKTATTVTGYVAGAVAAKLTAGALSGVTVEDVRNFVGDKVSDMAPEQVISAPVALETEIVADSTNEALQESINALHDEVIEKLDACINALQNELQDELTSVAPLPDVDTVEQPSLAEESDFVERQPDAGSLTADTVNPEGTNNSVLTAETVAEVFDIQTHIYPVVEGDPGVSYELKELYPEIFGDYSKDQWESFIDSVNNNPELLKASGIESGKLDLIFEGNKVRTDLLAEYAVAPEAKTYLVDAPVAPETSPRPMPRPEDLMDTNSSVVTESPRPMPRPDDLLQSNLAPTESIRPLPRPEGLGIVDPAILDGEAQALEIFETSADVTPETLYSQQFVLGSYNEALGSFMEIPESLQVEQLTELSAWAQENNVTSKEVLDARLEVIIQRDMLPAAYYNELKSDSPTSEILGYMLSEETGSPSLHERILNSSYGDTKATLYENTPLSVTTLALVTQLGAEIQGVASMTVGEIFEKAIEQGLVAVEDGTLKLKI